MCNIAGAVIMVSIRARIEQRARAFERHGRLLDGGVGLYRDKVAGVADLGRVGRRVDPDLDHERASGGDRAGCDLG
jgi:hypothetical protein